MVAYFVEAQAILPYTTNLPRDVCVNTFHFRADDSLGDTVVGNIILNRIRDFYNVTPGIGTVDIASYLSSVITRAAGGCRVKLYKLSDPLPRSPFYENTWTLDAASNTFSLPLEVSLCSSFRAAYDSGVPQASRRGRVYLGPFVQAAAVGVANAPPTPATPLINAAAGAMDELASNVSEPLVTFIQYSRKLSQGNDVVAGWVDNEFDTQRRRQTKATARTTWTV